MSDHSDKNDVSINVSLPKEITGELANFVGRILGPLGDTADLLSDKIRFVRYQSALKVMRLAKEMAEAADLEPKQVPLKFLVPFLEQCSLEDEDSELIERWAKLLVSAVTEHDPYHSAFVDILSQIGPNEANLLKHIWKRRKDEGFDKLKALLTIYGEDTGSYYGSKAISLDEWERDGFLIMAGSSISKHNEQTTELRENNIKSLSILERQNLIKIKAASGKHSKTDMQVFVVNAALTPLGYDFVSACEEIDE